MYVCDVVCVCAPAPVPTHWPEEAVVFSGVVSCPVQGLNSGTPEDWQMLLTTEPSLWPQGSSSIEPLEHPLAGEAIPVNAHCLSAQKSYFPFSIPLSTSFFKVQL